MVKTTKKKEVYVSESAIYNNYLNEDDRANDKYKNNLETFFDEPIPSSEIFVIPKKKTEIKNLVRIVQVHFKTIEDHLDFCNKVFQIIPFEKTEIFYPLENGTISDIDNKITNIDINLIRPKKNRGHTAYTKFEVEDDPNFIGTRKWMQHWKDMPAFNVVKNGPYKSVDVKIRTEEDLQTFGALTGYNMTNKTKFLWYPKINKNNKLIKRWVGEIKVPKYPMYIVSKGRHESMFTSRIFAKMQVPHYIVIEPQDLERYTKALETFQINPYATLLVAPFSNHGDGPGRARNWAWDHSIFLGAERHWVFDDNIKDFFRFHNNARYRTMTGALFNAMEDFVDRFENIKIAGPQYYFFCTDIQAYPPYVLNTRIYSALLIKNDIIHRWRGRYNEDTDLSLRVLKDGDVTIQFNAFLQGKMGTQLVKGGNTEEFYHKEGNTNKSDWRGGAMNATGTVNKSKMLVDMHPDVARLEWKYGRWHHFVDYSSFQNNQLIYKPSMKNIPRIENEYGMKFVDNYGIEEDELADEE